MAVKHLKDNKNKIMIMGYRKQYRNGG